MRINKGWNIITNNNHNQIRFIMFLRKIKRKYLLSSLMVFCLITGVYSGGKRLGTWGRAQGIKDNLIWKNRGGEGEHGGLRTFLHGRKGVRRGGHRGSRIFLHGRIGVGRHRGSRIFLHGRIGVKKGGYQYTRGSRIFLLYSYLKMYMK